MNGRCVRCQSQMPKHHDTGEQERRWVCLVLARDVWRGSMHGLEDGRGLTYVTAAREYETVTVVVMCLLRRPRQPSCNISPRDMRR